ncbi:MAG: 2-oxoacid:acceptor oxidoreductase family protein [Candidatus Omnitrophica bacterium]|nr:2-oxoacid:acceptor oxidoreductase family protein [Candidatus Omnitrophota bacterium]
MTVEILLSGFGGQGVMSLGKALATAALSEGKYSLYFPSYGAEVRGGTAYCFVKIADTVVASPLIENPDIAIILNQPSLDKFEKGLKKGCLLIANADLITRKPVRGDIKAVLAPLNAIALECGNSKVANIAALGILITLIPGLLKKETIITLLKKTFSSGELLEQNIKALDRGICYAAQHKE